MTADAYWARPTAALVDETASPAAGLGPDEVRRRLERDGPNTVRDDQSQPWTTILVRQVRSPLVLILLFAALVAGVVQEWLEAAIILGIVLGSILLSFSQEYRASTAVAALRSRLSLSAKVRRDGAVVAVPFRDIVIGDRVLLSAGAMVPADGVLISATDLQVSEAALTGESFPVEKRPGRSVGTAAIADRTNAVYLGSSVRSGLGEMLVVRTGRATEFGAVADQLSTVEPETEFARSVRQFGAMLIRVMVVVVLFVLTVNQLLGRPFLESLLFAVALGVGLSPELLPAIVSVTLSTGARALAAKGVLVRRLDAIENLGAMTVFCTDKTGTLTEGRIALRTCTDPQGAPSAQVAAWACLNAAFETGIENPLDQAILTAPDAPDAPTAGWRKLAEVPYDFQRKRLTVVVQAAAETAFGLLITKGAADTVLAVCDTVEGDGVATPLDEAARARLDGFVQARGQEGLRVLGLATRRLPVQAHYDRTFESGLCFAGFLVFADPPKAGVSETLAALAALGVGIKVLSGDNRHVVAHTAQALGLSSEPPVTGGQLRTMPDAALEAIVVKHTLFAEVDPQQKERVVRALKRRGAVVGYLGDGINDAPALHAADVGVSVDQAVDVARKSADVVLLRRDLAVLAEGVEGGRRTSANTLKYICITISANFGNMVSMAVATPLLPFLPMAAKQILLNNFLSDLPAMSISSDVVDAGQLARSQRMSVKRIQAFMIVFGLVSSAFDLLTFAVLLLLFHAGQGRFQTAWFVVSLLTELAVLLVLRTQGPAWKSRPSRTLMGLTVAVAGVGLASPYLGPVAALFDLTPLPPPLLGASVLIVLAYAAATEAAKLWFFRRAATQD